MPPPVTLLNEIGVSVCTRLHFGRAMERDQNFYIRLAYSGINTSEIKEGGLDGKFKAFIEVWSILDNVAGLPESTRGKGDDQ